MGFLDRLFGGFSSNQNEADDDYFLDDDYYDDDGYEEEPPRSGRVKNNKQADNGSSRGGGLFGTRKNVVQMSTPTFELSSKRPKVVDDFTSICDDLLDGKAVIINVEGISQDDAQRVLDFVYGTIYSIQGDVRKISKYIFAATPHSVPLTGEFADDYNTTNANSASYRNDSYSSRASGFGY